MSHRLRWILFISSLPDGWQVYDIMGNGRGGSEPGHIKTNATFIMQTDEDYAVCFRVLV